MKRTPDPLRLDVAALAAEQGRLSGHWSVADLPRLAQAQAAPDDLPLAGVEWQVEATRLGRPGAGEELWMSLSAHCQVWLQCQRCLQPYQVSLSPNNRFRFVRDEAEAEALDAELEEDVLALSQYIDLRHLVEDELLLALPLVPRHALCPEPLPMRIGDGQFDAGQNPSDPTDPTEPEHPFAKLRVLKTSTPGSGGE